MKEIRLVKDEKHHLKIRLLPSSKLFSCPSFFFFAFLLFPFFLLLGLALTLPRFESWSSPWFGKEDG